MAVCLQIFQDAKRVFLYLCFHFYLMKMMNCSNNPWSSKNNQQVVDQDCLCKSETYEGVRTNKTNK